MNDIDQPYAQTLGSPGDNLASQGNTRLCRLSHGARSNMNHTLRNYRNMRAVPVLFSLLMRQRERDQIITLPHRNHLIGPARNSRSGRDPLQTPHIATVAALTLPVYRHMPQFRRRPYNTLHNLPIRNHPTTDTCAHREIDHLFAATTSAKHMLPQGGCIGIIFNENRSRKLLLENIAQGHINPSLQVRRSENDPGSMVERSGRTNAYSCDIVRSHIGLVNGLMDCLNDARDYAIRSGIFSCQQCNTRNKFGAL